MSEYDLASVHLPRLTGPGLALFAASLENPATRILLMGKLLKDGGIETFRQMRLSEVPTYAPIATDKSAAGKAPIPALEEIVAAARPPAAPQGLAFPTIRDFAEAYRNKVTNPEEVAERLFAAVEASRAGDRPLGAVLAMNKDDVRAQARASAERIAAGRPLSVLDGVPIGVKDELDQRPYPTTVGTSFMGSSPAAEDATPVARLRAAGALLFAKLAMHEIGINPDGSNMNHGLVRNPYDLTRDTGGSSSGSAAAVAAGLCPAAIGADGGGSIRIPAALCGVVGLKATFGRISEHGAAPICWTVAHVGPIGATALDTALLYALIAGPDPKDAMSAHQPPPSLEGFGNTDLSGLTVGVYRPWFEHASSSVVKTCEDALRVMTDLGARVREIRIPELNAMRVAHVITILSEVAAAMDKAPREAFSPSTRVNLALGRAFTGSDYVHAQRMRTRAIAAFRAAFEEVDLIATPSTAMTAPAIPVPRAKDAWSDLESVTEVMRFIFPGNLTGLPAITFPVGSDPSGLPVGFHLMGRPWAEHVLLRAAHAVERRIARRRPATFYSLLPSHP